MMQLLHSLSWGDRIAWISILLYVAAMVAYLCGRQWWKATYFFAAALINVSVMMMKS
jgi:hypothetical protein